MRILLLVDCYSPYAKSSAVQMRDLALALRDEGHAIFVLTPSDQISQKMNVSTEDGITVLRVRTGKIKGSWKVQRAIGEARLSNQLWRRARHSLEQNPPDLVVFYSPTIFWGALVRRLKSHFHCPSYLILRDIFPSWAVDAGVLRKGLIYSYFRRKEIEQYKAADRIAVQSPANLRYFAGEFPSLARPLEVLYNWMDIREQRLPVTIYRPQLDLQGKVVFFYGGNLGVAQDVENIVRLAQHLAVNRHIHFVLVGDGSEVPRLKKIVRDQHVHNITLLPPVTPQQYLAMLSEFDVGLLSLDRRLTTHNVPGKLLSYMYWSKPILASINPGNDLFNIINDNHAGFCLTNGDDPELAATALQLGQSPKLRREMGENSRKILEALFSSQAAARQILHHFVSQSMQSKNELAAMAATD